MTTFLSVNAQKERKLIREGNSLFHKNDFEKSEVEYRKALDKKDKSYEAKFNLGDALYKQKKFDKALDVFRSLTISENDKNNLADLYHNIGNTYIGQQKLTEAIEAFKTSLRNNPRSKDTKYNLEWARSKQQKNQDQKDKKDKKDKKDQKEQKDQKDKKEQKDQKNKISKADAKRLLEALQNDEKKVQEKVKKAKVKTQKAKKSKVSKDW
jgi:tetratricopeptide (TPR) repeat protein